MKLFIHLTEEMASMLLRVAQRERRYPRQQVEVMLEDALREACEKLRAQDDCKENSNDA